MAITKETVIGKIEMVGQFKAVQVAIDTLIKEDGKVISQTRHRQVLHSDMDISNQPQEVQNICNTAWTQEVKDAWIAFKQEQENNLG
jgi:uncharacterized protein (DUF302 family)